MGRERIMILPFVPPYWAFQATTAVAKGEQVRPVHFIGFALISTAPITLQPKDVIVIDIRSGVVTSIQRGGITIWRDVWKN